MLSLHFSDFSVGRPTKMKSYSEMSKEERDELETKFQSSLKDENLKPWEKEAVEEAAKKIFPKGHALNPEKSKSGKTKKNFIPKLPGIKG